MSEVVIKFGEYEASIREKGAGLNWLRHMNRNLVDPYQPMDTRFFRGDLLAPWPNRIRDGIYLVDGITYRAPINESARMTALHGLIFDLNWKITQRTESIVKLEVELLASEAYPTSLHIEVKYSLSQAGLEISIAASNTGARRAPYGVSIHPYLVATPGSSVDEWSLQLPSHQVLEVDADRLLPIALKDCRELNFDFRGGEIIGNRFIDHAFKVDLNLPRVIILKATNGHGVRMSFDETLPWIQIHTADRDGGIGSRTCLAVEPMTCPPDAFRSGEDLIWLDAGDRTQSTWKIENLEGEINAK